MTARVLIAASGVSVLALLLCFLTVRPAHAYIDPGTGSYVLQAVAATAPDRPADALPVGVRGHSSRSTGRCSAGWGPGTFVPPPVSWEQPESDALRQPNNPTTQQPATQQPGNLRHPPAET